MLKTSMLKQLGGLKNHVFDHEARKSGLFPCYRLKINDFLSNYNQNLKIDIFTPLQQIPCYCKNSLSTLRLISWWRVTYVCLFLASRRCSCVHARLMVKGSWARSICNICLSVAAGQDVQTDTSPGHAFHVAGT